MELGEEPRIVAVEILLQLGLQSKPLELHLANFVGAHHGLGGSRPVFGKRTTIGFFRSKQPRIGLRFDILIVPNK